jgi:hypothetical protein
MGKSYLTREIIAPEPRVVILDTMGEHSGRGTLVVWGRDEAIRAMRDAAGKRRYKLSLRGLDEDEMLDALEMGWDLTDYLLVVEETSMICGPSVKPRELMRLLRYGRHRNISQLYIARRPSELPRDLTAQSDLVVTLQQTEPVDLKYLRASGFKESELLALAAMPEDRARGYILVRGDVARAPLAIVERLHSQKPLPGSQAKLDLTDDLEPDTTPPDEAPPGESEASEAS